MREVTMSNAAVAAAKTDAPWRGQPWTCHTCGRWWVMEGWKDTTGELDYGNAYEHGPDAPVVTVRTAVHCQAEGCDGVAWVSTSVPNPWYDPSFLKEVSPWSAKMAEARYPGPGNPYRDLPIPSEIEQEWKGVEMSTPMGSDGSKWMVGGAAVAIVATLVILWVVIYWWPGVV